MGSGRGRVGERYWPRAAAGGGVRLVATPVTSAPYVAAGRAPATKNLIARPVRTAAVMRRKRARLLWQRANRRTRVLRRAAQRLRPPTVSTPRTEALVQGWPPRRPSASRIRHAIEGLSTMTVALGGEKGVPFLPLQRTDEV